MGLRQRGNESEMTSEKKKLRTKRKKNCEKEEERGYQRKRGQESKEVRDKSKTDGRTDGRSELIYKILHVHKSNCTHFLLKYVNAHAPFLNCLTTRCHCNHFGNKN
jgi:hypothetical protein